MPLAAGLSLGQFAGVLAHEFGHFSQGAGMRLTFLIRSISLWFHRVVYERDSWDQTLDAWMRQANASILIVAALTKALVWLTRRVLWLLMMAGHAISCFMLRQMEFDADRYEARLSGSDVFETTSRRLRLLGVAAQGARADLAAGWNEGRLGDDLPALIVLNLGQLPSEVVSQVDKALESAETGTFDTHPADRDRIASARAEQAPGIFRLDGPATLLFRHFARTSKAATFAFYREIFGEEIPKERLYPVADLFQKQEAVQESNKALLRFFLEEFHPLRPLPLPENRPAPASDSGLLAKSLRSAHREMAAARASHARALKAYGELDARLANLDALNLLADAGCRIKPAAFALPDGDPEALAEEDAAELGRLSAVLRTYERLAAQRLHSALRLVDAPDLPGRIAEAAAHREEIVRLYPTLIALHGGTPAIVAVHRAHRALLAIFEHFEGHENDQRWHKAILRGARRLHQALQEAEASVGGGMAYPFDHAEVGMTVAAHVLPGVPGPEAVGDLARVADDAVDKFVALSCRILGRLVVMAEQVEEALGLPAIAIPKKSEA